MRERGFALSLGLPEDATSDCARVTLSGQSAALVEGQHGVIELTDSRVRLRTGRGVLTVLGEGENGFLYVQWGGYTGYDSGAYVTPFGAQ